MGNFTTAKAITFLDIETSHLDPSKAAILQISVITDWDNGDVDIWTTKIKPKDIELDFASSDALKICGYNKKDWEDAPSFEDVAEKIISKLKYGPLVAHNIQFDISHIEANLRRYGYGREDRENKLKRKGTYRLGYPMIDTCAVSYIFFPTERQNLTALREHFELDHEGAHTSEKDCEDCRTVFYKIIEKTLR